MAGRGDTKDLRKFGLLVGGVFGAIGLWPSIVRQEDPRLWAIGLAVALILPAVAMPRVLATPHRIWMTMAEALGWLNSRLLLGLVFYGLLTPMGIAMRLRGRDPMRRRLEPRADSYRVLRQPRPGSHMARQF